MRRMISLADTACALVVSMRERQRFKRKRVRLRDILASSISGEWRGGDSHARRRAKSRKR